MELRDCLDWRFSRNNSGAPLKSIVTLASTLCERKYNAAHIKAALPPHARLYTSPDGSVKVRARGRYVQPRPQID